MLSIRKIVDSYFSKRTFPYWCVLLLDSAILFLSGVFVYWCFNRGTALQLNFWPLTHLMLLCVGVHFIFFAIFRTYSEIIRYSSFNDLIRVAQAMGCSALAVIAVHFFTNSCPSRVFAHVQVRQILIAEAIATGLMWLLRVSIKWVYDTYFRTEAAKNVFIYGIRDGGIGLAKAIRSEKPMHYRLRGFISHDPALGANGTRLMGEPVYEVNASLPDLIRREGIAAVLVAPGRIDRFRNDTALQDYILQSGARIFSANNVVDTEHDAIKGAPTLKEVRIEDLLPRDEICVDLESVAESLRGKRVLITGSAGSIGSEIVRQVASFAPSKMMLIDSAETPQHDIRRMMAHDFPSVPCATVVTSITKADRMENIFKTFLPEYVFHAAAYKHVPMMEDNPCESIQNNVLGTKILADLSVKYGVRRFVMVSTDKAVNPTNIMGCTKRLAEIYVQSLGLAIEQGHKEGKTKFVTTRFGNVLGSNGSVIPRFREQIAKGGPVTVTHPDITRFFMTIPEACRLVMEAAAMSEGNQIFVFDMGASVKISHLAERMIELAGFVPGRDIKIEYTGLRPGEKLYEEVLSNAENTLPTHHDRIRVAKVREYAYADALAAAEKLEDLSREVKIPEMVVLMKQTVPEFKSKNSVYEKYDKKD